MNVQGKIFDADTREPLYAAHIYKHHADDSRTPVQTISNMNGSFFADGFLPSDKIGFSYLNYDYQVFPTNQEHFYLQRKDFGIEEVTITAERKKTSQKNSKKWLWWLVPVIFIALIIANK